MGRTRRKVKLLVIGLDGADPDLLKEWNLPNLRSFDIYKLKSTLPPSTAPAWTSCITGKNPGKHGVSHFMDMDPFIEGNNRSEVVNSTSIDSYKFWNVLNHYGISTGLMGIPVTYPVEHVKGFMISGMLTPRTVKDFYYPSTLGLDDYEIFIPYSTYRRLFFKPLYGKWFLEKIYKNTKRKFKIAKELMRKVDVFFMVESNTDQIQHFFFYNGVTDRAKETIGNFFHFVDSLLEDLIGEIDCPVILLSDHGFGREQKKFVRVNSWLKERGLFKEIPRRKWFLKSWLIKRGYIDETPQIDWRETKAYFFGDNNLTGFIRILDGNRDEIIEDLRKERFVDQVFTKENIYSGPYLKYAAHIIVTFKEGYTPKNGIGQVVQEMPYPRKFASHRINGFYTIGNCNCELGDAEIYDIAPTILNLLGCPIPDDMDGKPLAGGEPQFKPFSQYNRESHRFSEEEKEELKERLRRLGYL